MVNYRCFSLTPKREVVVGEVGVWKSDNDPVKHKSSHGHKIYKWLNRNQYSWTLLSPESFSGLKQNILKSNLQEVYTQAELNFTLKTCLAHSQLKPVEYCYNLASENFNIQNLDENSW